MTVRFLILSILLYLIACREKTQNAVVNQTVSINSSNSSISARKRVHLLATKNHNAISYKAVWEALKYIDGEENSVRLIYSRELRSKDLQGGSKGDWNREHLWSRSYGIEKSGIDFTDLHNIFPCDMQTNSRRGNKYFDNETDIDSWLPPADMRGDIARGMFYMVVRYEGNEAKTIDLELSDEPNNELGKFGKLSTLLEWNEQDTVSDEEILRNDRIEEIQGNRNPFVDNPELVEEVFIL